MVLAETSEFPIFLLNPSFCHPSIGSRPVKLSQSGSNQSSQGSTESHPAVYLMLSINYEQLRIYAASNLGLAGLEFRIAP